MPVLFIVIRCPKVPTSFVQNDKPPPVLSNVEPIKATLLSLSVLPLATKLMPPIEPASVASLLKTNCDCEFDVVAVDELLISKTLLLPPCP